MIGTWAPFVTVIVPAYNAHLTLHACLQRLSQQTYSHYEVIVVDNGSQPSLQPLVEVFPGIVFVREETPGSYVARNAGLKHARGDVIAFTDSDCIPSADWIENGVGCLLQSPECGLVGGQIELTFKNPHAPTVWEFCDYLCHGGFPQRYFVEHDHFAATANAFMTREALEKVGPFNANLMSGGDLDWGQRAASAGYQLVYAPNVVVLHPAHTGVKPLVKKSRRLEGGVRDFLRNHRDYRASLSFKRRLVPPFVWRLREDYLRLKAYPTLMGHPLQVSALTTMGTVGMMCFLRSIRSLEKIRLAFGASSFRG